MRGCGQFGGRAGCARTSGSPVLPARAVQWRERMSAAGCGVRTTRWSYALVIGLVLFLLGLSATAGVDQASAASSTGTVLSIAAGDGGHSAIIPGPAVSSPIYYPASLAADRHGNVFVSFSS